MANGELPASTDIDGLSRFYLGVFQGMAVQARDGASPGGIERRRRSGDGCLAGRRLI